jgi:hypothetical protein
VLASCAQQATTPAAASSTPSSQTSAPGAKPAPAASAVDPGVIQQLDRMGDFLRTLKNFEVTLSSTTDATLDNDQLAQVNRSARMKVRRPDGLLADIGEDSGDRRMLVYNGKTATLFDPQTKYYATVKAPPTLKEVTTVLSERYGIELPAADLFAWGTDKVDKSGIKSADFLGTAVIDGTLTDHFAIRQDGFDWQIWIEQGRTPVPRKLVITTTSDVARPQHSVLMRWNLAPKFTAGIFDFKPPAGSQRIVIQKVDGTVESPAN